MGRMMRHQMDHCERKIRNIQYDLIGRKPTLRVISVSDTKIAEAHLDGTRKITPAIFTKACLRYQAELATKQYSAMSLAAAIGITLHDVENAAAKKRYDKEMAQYEAREQRINKRAAKCIDQIILGGEEVALKMIETFASMKV